MKEAIILSLATGVGWLISYLIPVDLSPSSERVMTFIGIGAALCGGACWIVVSRLDKAWLEILVAVGALSLLVYSALQVLGIVTGEPGAEMLQSLFIWSAFGIFSQGVLFEAAGLKIAGE